MISNFKTMTDLWHGICERLLFAHKSELEVYTGSVGSIYGCYLTADSMEFDFSVGHDLWLTKARFPVLQRDYLDPALVNAFIERAVHASDKKGSIASMPTKHATYADGRDRHAWGNCMMGFAFHGGKSTPPTFSMFSRTSFVSFLGSLDMAVGWLLAKEIARGLGMDYHDFRFAWHLQCAGWHVMKGVSYCINQGLIEEMRDSTTYPPLQYPIINKTLQSLQRFEDNRLAGLTTIEQLKYGPAWRINKRYRNMMEGNPLPALRADELYLLPEMLAGPSLAENWRHQR